MANGSGVGFVPELTSAVGDMANTMALSALVSPSSTTPGSRNLVVNLWDWDVAASWDDGATWAGWAPAEKSPGACGEGGGGTGMGASGKLVMFHRNHWYSSLDGGHNFIRGDLPGSASAFDYVRRPGSRSEPSGLCFALMSAPPGSELAARGTGTAAAGGGGGGGGDEGRDYTPLLPKAYLASTASLVEHLAAKARAHDKAAEAGEVEVEAGAGRYTPGLRQVAAGTQAYLMTSADAGRNWTWSPLPAWLQAGGLAVDTTSANSLFALTASCLAHSADHGKSWSGCSRAPGLSGSFAQLVVKDARVMFMLRSGAVPLRTRDGGLSWHELGACAPLFKHGATMAGSLSWSGATLVLSGADLSAVGRGEYATAVWKSTNDGDDWTDETGDLVTISPGPAVWYEKDLYLVTRGEGVTVKRNFDAGADMVEK